MTQKTSWEGTKTKVLRQRGMKGGYTRYSNRQTRQGLQVVKNRGNYNMVFTPDGRLIGIEPHYRNFATDDRSARKIYNQRIKRRIPKELRKKILG